MQEDLNKPLISVIIPAYNAEKFIHETLQSVLNQTYTNFEIIVLNDGSTDKTKEIVEKFQLSDSRIKLINKVNTGVSDTRNLGMQKANGKYIALLDADDVWLPDNLEKKISVLEKNPEIHFVYGDMYLADEKLQNLQEAAKGKKEMILENILLWNGEVIPGPCSNLLFKKSCLDNNITFSPLLSTIADKHFSAQLARYFKGYYIPEILWIYRVVKGSMSKSMIVMEKDCLEVYNLYKKNNFFPNKNFENKCFANMYLILAGSWWKDGKNKIKAIKYILKAFITKPLYTLKKLLTKIF
jgi:glycosyltransferase involved in cell wall biosynthesis